MSVPFKFLTSPLRWLMAAFGFCCFALALIWAALAIYYSNLPSTGLRIALAIAYAAFTIWAIWFSHQRRMLVMVGNGGSAVLRRGRMVDSHSPLA